MENNKKVCFLELNEFNPDLLTKIAEELSLKNLEKLTSFQRINTFTEDTYDSDFLEPWVQWVSIHTGTPSSHHQIKHLGDVPHLSSKQLWEELSERGISSGIWGAMNASRNGSEKCLFFVPDPWTASEEAYPKELGSLLDPIRYASKNYLNRSNLILLSKIKNLLKLVIKNKIGRKLLQELPLVIKNGIKYKGKSFVFIAFAEYLSTLLFLEYKKKYNPDFSLLFLNSLAHLQHHHWKDLDPTKNKPIVYGLRYLDRILGFLFDSIKDHDVLLVTNALSQKNTNEEKPWILYRQKDQSQFLYVIGIPHTKVESLMTHDAHIFFANATDMAFAKKTLSSIEIQGQKLFLIEEYAKESLKLFYRICFTDEIPKETLFTVSKKQLRFFDLFEPIVKRTGKHIPHGMVFCNQPSDLSSIKNHEIFDYILNLFKASHATKS